ncbi:hypothetical protein [Streptomyces sp. PA5.6]|uniref:hypothetical protein n=1 Tax=Streptomyces sp. PA5.6 TaxID=3035651 RepID=UPI003904B8D2
MSGDVLVINGLTGPQFLAETFEFEFCAECGGDVEQHIARPDMFGKWHAWCKDVETVRKEPPKDSPMCGWQTEYGTVNGPKFCAVDKGEGLDWCTQHDRIAQEGHGYGWGG